MGEDYRGVSYERGRLGVKTMAHMDCVKGSVLVGMRAAQSQVDKQLL